MKHRAFIGEEFPDQLRALGILKSAVILGCEWLKDLGFAKLA